MDKFGIFKLLSSFLTQNGQNSNSENNNSSASSSEENPLSTLLNSLTKTIASPPQNTQSQTPTPEIRKTFVPLQSEMLSTMNSHDLFIKRVKEKSKE